jgi:steroid delta-isomerase-like uncharacterized protein
MAAITSRDAVAVEGGLASSAPLGVARARELLSREFEAWNSHDPGRVLATVTDDILWEDPSMPGGRVRGKQAVREWGESLWCASPDMTFEIVGEPLISGRRVAVSWRATGHMSSVPGLPGSAPAGTAYETVGIDVVEFEGDLVRRESSFYDSSMPGQFDAVPKQAPGQGA